MFSGSRTACFLGALFLLVWSQHVTAEEQTIAISADSFLKSGTPHKNQGDLDYLRVKMEGSNRSLLLAEQAELQAALTGFCFQQLWN